MKKFKKLVIGGIETRIFNLILITVIVMIAAFMVVAIYQYNTLASLTAETGEKQKAKSLETTSGTMDTVARVSIDRLTVREARIVDEMFLRVKSRVTLLAQYAEAVFANPDSYRRAKQLLGPTDGGRKELSVYMVLADGVDRAAEADTLELSGALGDVMLSLCSASGADNIYLGLENGAFIKADKRDDSWFNEDGTPRTYDPRSRDWYLLAKETREPVIHINTEDFSTGAFCVEVAVPVVVNGEVVAVAGADVFREDMESVLMDAVEDGGYRIIADDRGRVIYSPNEDIVRAYGKNSDLNLRDSPNAALTSLVNAAFLSEDGKSAVGVVDTQGSGYYMIAVRIPTLNWVLLSAFSKEAVDAPARSLVTDYDSIEAEAIATYRAKNAQSRTNTIILIGLLAAAMLGLSLWLGKRIVRPLNTITRRISELGEDNPEFKMEDSFRTGDEIEVLAQSFASLSHKTVEYVQEVTRVTAEKERIGTELHMANQIQESMLPSIFPAFPDRSEFDIYATMTPAKEVGGDFYDFFLIDSDHLCMVMADVSGKGVPAALFMMASKIILKSCAMMGSSPAEILAKTNETICANNKMEMFVTVWLGILEISTGHLVTASAGHEYPALQQGEGYSLFHDKHGFVVGGMNGVRYKECELWLKPGDRIFVYTDGVPEATNGDKELFGTQRMLEALNADPQADPAQALNNVRRAVDRFVGDAEQFDDLTMMCMAYKGSNA